MASIFTVGGRKNSSYNIVKAFGVSYSIGDIRKMSLEQRKAVLDDAVKYGYSREEIIRRWQEHNIYVL